MKIWVLVVMSVMTLLVVRAEEARSVTKYTTRYDHLNLDVILNNRRLVMSYVDCLLGKKRCSPDASELKRTLPDALATRCAKCTTRQREGARRVIGHLERQFPKEFKLLLEKWDPTGEHFKRFREGAGFGQTTVAAS
uniref:Uncharacterized protein n=1 Tax=Timema bartmani TaxID=61472 RepID=A0A7R9I7T2_9NEOP|nr:unnamed protein product [Timema bartmani]